MDTSTYVVPGGFDLEGFDVDGDDLCDGLADHNGGEPEELERMEPEDGMRL